MSKHDIDRPARLALCWRMNDEDVPRVSVGIWKAFAKAVTCGAIAAAMLPTILIAMMLIASMLSNPVALSGVLAAFGLLLLPFTVAVMVTTILSAVIGLPLTMALRRARCESAFNYTLAGGACGSGITVLWGAITPAGRPNLSLALLGAVGGTVTARTWWKELSPVTIAQA